MVYEGFFPQTRRKRDELKPTRKQMYSFKLGRGRKPTAGVPPTQRVCNVGREGKQREVLSTACLQRPT